MSKTSVINIKNTKKSADTEPVGILRLGRFNSPKTKQKFSKP